MGYIISGIQQMGIGVKDADQFFDWYKTHFGMDVPVFKERAVAGLMLPYTGGKPQSRYAILALNMQGGGGFEIWQYTERTPQPAAEQAVLGDLGLFLAKLKSQHVDNAHAAYQEKGLSVSAISKDPSGRKHFYVTDPAGNWFEVVESEQAFTSTAAANGGIFGSVIGVSNIERSLPLYQKILGYDRVLSDTEGVFSDWSVLPGHERRVRRVVLEHTKTRQGAFSPLLGNSEIELVQWLDGKGESIFRDRYWGDLGFIHLCFDIRDMDALKKACEDMGYAFTVDSANSFDMGEAAGRFAYIEDPDGTLIEFVETHKVPVAKKLGIYLNLKKRPPHKPLPRLFLRALALNK